MKARMKSVVQIRVQRYIQKTMKNFRNKSNIRLVNNKKDHV